MQDAQLGNFAWLLLVLIAIVSLFGLRSLDSSRRARRRADSKAFAWSRVSISSRKIQLLSTLFRTAPACEAPRWTGIAVLLVTWLTVGSQALQTALRNPVQALRQD